MTFLGEIYSFGVLIREEIIFFVSSNLRVLFFNLALIIKRLRAPSNSLIFFVIVSAKYLRDYSGTKS